MFKNFNDLPEKMKNESVKKYYDILEKKKLQIYLKRFFDIIISLIMLIILSPIFLIIAISIKIDSKGPVFYRQERVTKYNKNFRIFKFRTMVQNADKIGALITIGNDSRITRIGKLIRKCRLDEIPQLINVLIGDMSFVGTRPEVRKYVDKYNDEMFATLLLPAGITSNASIEFKNEDEIINKYLAQGEEIDSIYVNKILPDKMKINLEYIEKFNFFKDFSIMLKTLIAVIKKDKTIE